MRIIKLAMAAALAAGLSGMAFADDDAAPDSIYKYGPLLRSEETGALTYGPANNATYGPFAPMPASPWVQERFNTNQNLTVDSKDFWMERQTNWVPPGSGGE